MKQLFLVKQDNPNRDKVIALAVDSIRAHASEGADFEVVLQEPRRTLDANAAMWASLTDFRKHVQWMVTDRYGKQVPATNEDCKDILTAAFEGETRMAMGLNGGIVILGARTSKYSRKKMGDFLKFLHAEGDERGVVWSKKAKDDLDFYAMGRE